MVSAQLRHVAKVNKLRVGLTGGIASGKTLVAAMLEVCGAPVAFADGMARGLMERPGPVRDQLVALLGVKAYTQEGKLDRPALGRRLFDDPQLLEAVNRIVHPAVGDAARAWHESANPPCNYTVYESALLFETGAAAQFDVVVLVHAPMGQRLERAIARDNTDADQVRARMEAQWSDEQRLAQHAYVILNDGSRSLVQQVHALHRTLVERRG